MKYALVEWTSSNSSSIILASGIKNAAMLEDSSIVDKVEDIVEGVKKPSDGWRSYDGRIIATSGELVISLNYLKVIQYSMYRAGQR